DNARSSCSSASAADRRRLPNWATVSCLRLRTDDLQIRFAETRRLHRRVIRLSIKDCRLWIKCGARPVDAAKSITDINRTENLSIRDNRWNVWRRFPLITFQIFQRLCTQRRREIDQIIHREERSRVRRGLRRDWLGWRCLFARDIALGDRLLGYRPYRLTRYPVEHVQVTLFSWLCDQLPRTTVDHRVH